MKNLIFALLPFVVACSSAQDPEPVAPSTRSVSTFTIAKHKIDGDRFHIYLFGADTLTFTNIVPDQGLVDVFLFDAIEGTPGKFKNASLYQGGKQTQVLTSGRLEIRAFSPGSSIDLVYDVTFENGRRLQGSWAGKISGI